MEVEKVETSPDNDKKGYNPDEIKTIVDVLDQNALMNIIDSELPSYTGSKMLKLSKLGINKLEALSCLDHLNRLDLSYNKLKSVRALGNLTELTYLNLSYNQLSGKGIRGILALENLVFLNLGNNRISILPDFAFANMSKLQCLLLNNNKLNEIAFISILSELNTLVLSNNAIQSLPADCFKNLTKLRKLSLGHNQLTEFPSIFHIETLKEVNLNGNKISSIPDQITNLHHLTQLDIGNNLIENVQSLSIFKSMTVLMKLNVAQNTFYGLSEGQQDVAVIEKVNKTICSMLPQLTTLNNRQLALGKEKKESRKKHYEEKLALQKGGEKKEMDEGKEKTEKKVEKVEKKKVVAKKVEKKKNEKKMEKKKVEKVEKKKSAPTETPVEPVTPEEEPEEKPMEAAQSGIVEVETVTTQQHAKSTAEDVENFLLGKDTKEELDGWD